MPKLDKRLLTEVADTVLEGQTALFLTPNAQVTDGVAEQFRRAFILRAMEVNNCAEITARKLLRPEGANPAFIQLARRAGWVYFGATEGLSAHDECGNPTMVYWPTVDFDYQKVSYLGWRRERMGSIWRPTTMKGSLIWEDAPTATKVAKGPRDAWQALLDNDDF